MLLSSYKKGVVFITIFSFIMTLFILPTNAQAKWVSNTPESEGMSTTTLILIGVGVAVIMYVLLSSSESDEIAAIESDENQLMKETESVVFKSSSENDKLNPKKKFKNTEQVMSQEESNITVMPILELKKNDPGLYPAYGKSMTNLGVKSGTFFQLLDRMYTIELFVRSSCGTKINRPPVGSVGFEADF